MSVQKQPLSGVINPLLLLALWCSLSFSSEISIHQVNRVTGKTLSNNSYIRQGGIIITTSNHREKESINGNDKNSSNIIQGVIVLDANSSIDIEKNITNIIAP